MNIKGIAWAGFKTKEFEKMIGFFRDILELKICFIDKDVVTFQLPNGDLFEIIGPTQATELDNMSGLKIDFLVDNVDSAVDELIKKGCKMSSVIFHAKDQNWVNFIGPNGSYFGLTDFFSHPAHCVDKRILFYGPHGEYGFLSNWYLSPIFAKGKIWPSTEHYYHAQKFAGTKNEEICRRLATPRETLEFSRRPDVTIDPKWNERKKDVMIEAIEAKFSQNPELGEKLVATGQREIVENSPIDSFWGIGADGRGKNELGKILMNYRDKLNT